MDNIRIQVSGDKELARQLNALPAAASRQALLEAVEEAAEVIEISMKSKVNDSGNKEHPAGTLRNSISQKVTLKTKNKVAVAIGPNADQPEGKGPGFYGRFVEFGHAIVPSWGHKRAYKGDSIGRVPAHPFMRPAFDENVERTIDKIGQRLWQTMRRLARI